MEAKEIPSNTYNTLKITREDLGSLKTQGKKKVDKLLDTSDISKLNQGEIINLNGLLTRHKIVAVQDPTNKETSNIGRTDR